MTTRLWSVEFDANDPAALARFWADTLGWRVKDKDAYSTVSHGEGFLPRIDFVPVPEPKTSKNRIHFDLPTASPEDRDRRVEQLIAFGARHVDIGQPKDTSWTVLADPEGNEFCITQPVPSPRAFSGTGPIHAIAYDATDAATLGRFWSAATGWPILYEREQIVFLRSPNATGPVITVSGPPERVAPKPVKNRVHLDVAPYPSDDQNAEVERLAGLGAQRIDIGQSDVTWIVIADPEGNEFCVLTPR
jgi:predicted enzyme related to lactoylglutathione lyase